MARHEREIKIKRIVKAFTYFLIIAFLLILFMVIRSLEKKKLVPGTPSKQVSMVVSPTEDPVNDLPF